MHIWRISEREALLTPCPKCEVGANVRCRRMAFSSYRNTEAIKRPHDERFHAAARSKLDHRRIVYRETVRGILTEFDRREEERLRAWLTNNWKIFTIPGGSNG